MTPLRTLGDLLAVVPYLLGFHPADSMVVLGLRDRQIAFQVRADLPDPADAPGLAEYYAELTARQRVDRAVVLGYGDGPAVMPVVLALCPALEARGVLVVDAVRVAGGRYWSYLCEDPACCRPDGHPYDSVGPPAVAAVVEGCVALPSREALERRLAPVGGAARAAMTAAVGRAGDRMAEMIGADLAGFGDSLRRAGTAAVDAAVAGYRGGARLTDDELAWLTIVLLYLPVRDHAWTAVGGDLGRHVLLWTDVVRRADPDLSAAPATLLAFAAWRAGEGALATIALSRALDADPEYPMARYLKRALSGGLSPMEWEAARAHA
jgi:hypothetical protein